MDKTSSDRSEIDVVSKTTINPENIFNKRVIVSSHRSKLSLFQATFKIEQTKCKIIFLLIDEIRKSTLRNICNTWKEKEKKRRNYKTPSGNTCPQARNNIFEPRDSLSLLFSRLRFSHARRPSISTVSQLIIRIKRNRDGSYPRLLKGSRGRIITESPRFGKACMRFLELRTRMQEMVHGEKGLRDGNNDGRMSRLSRYSPTSAFESFLKISVKK